VRLTATIADINAAFNAGTLTAENLVQLCLTRIQSYDRQGPSLHAVMAINPKAVETARELDAERKAKGPRSALHGIPVVLKDNYNTADMPTTGGSVLLEGSVPPGDAFVVKKLRDAGAIILAKVNMSEFALSGDPLGAIGAAPRSSLGGQSLNPHDLARSPAGSSSGTGVAVSASYAPLGMGTDTGGSIRGPSTANGIVGLKPTHGLLSRSGIIPLALTFDTGGPMARSVSDVAVALGAMTGIDPADFPKRSGDRVKTNHRASVSLVKLLRAGGLRAIWVPDSVHEAVRDLTRAREVAILRWRRRSGPGGDLRRRRCVAERRSGRRRTRSSCTQRGASHGAHAHGMLPTRNSEWQARPLR
jgi:Asp-tRNA(Asn)/Glu-tRNA(Gln) amidotransferase A subunit family amidase